MAQKATILSIESTNDPRVKRAQVKFENGSTRSYALTDDAAKSYQEEVDRNGYSPEQVTKILKGKEIEFTVESTGTGVNNIRQLRIPFLNRRQQQPKIEGE